MKGCFTKYKVYDTGRKCFVTDDPCIVLKPDGRLAVNECGDEVGIPHCIALFYPTDSGDYYIDEVGGVHDSCDFEDVSEVLKPACHQCKSKASCLSLVGTGSMNKCIWWGYLVIHSEDMKD